MGLDLSSVKDFNDGLMVDEIVTYIPVDDDEGTWDETQGIYIKKPKVIRYEGKCQFWSSKQGLMMPTEGQEVQSVSTYYFEVPLESEEFQVEDIIRVTKVSTQGNRQMFGREFLVKGKDFYTYSVSQIVRAELREPNPS